MKILKLVIFERFQHAIPQKKAFFHIEFNFAQKKYDSFEKKRKNHMSPIFFVKIHTDHLSISFNFSNLCQKISKLSETVLWKGFKVKSHQRELIISA